MVSIMSVVLLLVAPSVPRLKQPDQLVSLLRGRVAAPADARVGCTRHHVCQALAVLDIAIKTMPVRLHVGLP